VSVLFGDSFSCCVYSDQKPVHQERGNRRAVTHDRTTTATNISSKYQEGFSDGISKPRLPLGMYSCAEKKHLATYIKPGKALSLRVEDIGRRRLLT
jgi:hypothetical protein